VDQSIISTTNATILWRMHGPRRTTSALIGYDLGISGSAVRERSRQAVRAISAAVRHKLGTGARDVA
jgi:hypothetical protein